MHRYLARAIACLILALAFVMLQIVVPHVGKKVVSVRTDGQTADIVAAVEALKRSDATIKVVDDPWVTNPVSGVVLSSLALAAVLWLSSSVVKRLEAKMVSTPEKK